MVEKLATGETRQNENRRATRTMMTEIGKLGPDEFAILDEPLGLVRVWLWVEYLVPSSHRSQHK